jgi:hypothetical protein
MAMPSALQQVGNGADPLVTAMLVGKGVGEEEE